MELVVGSALELSAKGVSHSASTEYRYGLRKLFQCIIVNRKQETIFETHPLLHQANSVAYNCSFA